MNTIKIPICMCEVLKELIKILYVYIVKAEQGAREVAQRIRILGVQA